MIQIEEKYLPKEILQKAIISGNEYGWKRHDFKEVLDKAVESGLSIIGGQVQFKLPDGTCELYWHSYDTSNRKPDENWMTYCQRTKNECLFQFENLPTNEELIADGIKNLEFLKDKHKSKIDIGKNPIFILYFDILEESNQ